MTPEDIKRIEEKFSIVAPRDWVQVMLNYPEKLATLAMPDGSLIREYDLCNDADFLIELNDEVRLEPITDGDYSLLEWPEPILVIGDDGGGDYFCLDVGDPEGLVWRFDHIRCQFYDYADSVTQYVAALIEAYSPDASPEEPK